MKLQKRFLRKYGGKDYYKYVVNIPPEIVEKINLSEGDELSVDIKADKIILSKKP